MKEKRLLFSMAVILIIMMVAYISLFIPQETDFIKIEVRIPKEILEKSQGRNSETPIPEIFIDSKSHLCKEAPFSGGDFERIAPVKLPQEFNDRTQPRYAVHRDGIEIKIPIDLQWYIFDMATEYDFPEELIYGMILLESNFNPEAIGDQGKSFGLAQIQAYWLTSPYVIRLAPNPESRDLLNPYDNILTLMELWISARDNYNLDVYTYEGQYHLLYWHNTGQDPTGVTKFLYCDVALDYAVNNVEKIYGKEKYD